MKKIVTLAAATVAAVPMLAMAAPVFADSPGQLMGGNALYQVKNLTQKGAYASTISASACDEVQYSIEIHNTEFGKLSNVTVKVALPSTSSTSNVSTVSASATNSAGTNVSVNGSVTVNTSVAQTVTYEAGSTQLFKGDGTFDRSLNDGIVGNGLSLGDLNGSTGEFVNFKAKLNCETPKQIQVCEIATKKIVTINEKDFNSTTQTKDLTKCAETPATPTVLPNTGAGNVVGIVGGAIVAGFVASRLFLSRKASR